MSKIFNRHNIIIFCAFLTAMAAAQKITQSFSLTTNGKINTEKAIVLNNKTYYPESALKALGVSVKRNGNIIALVANTIAGGANQTAALEGCIGETLFNGALRVTLHSFEILQKDGVNTGWTADLEFRNGTPTTSALYNFGIEQNFYIAYDDASTYPFYVYDANGISGARDIPAASSYRVKINFWPETSNAPSLPFDPSRKPVKLLLGFKKVSASSDNQKLLVADPSFRFKLDCKK